MRKSTSKACRMTSADFLDVETADTMNRDRPRLVIGMRATSEKSNSKKSHAPMVADCHATVLRNDRKIIRNKFVAEIKAHRKSKDMAHAGRNTDRTALGLTVEIFSDPQSHIIVHATCVSHRLITPVDELRREANQIALVAVVDTHEPVAEITQVEISRSHTHGHFVCNLKRSGQS